jgi:transducin (beta)-like 1
VESHWRADGLTNNCKNGFSLLEPHACSLEEPSEKTVPGQDIPMDISESSQLSMTGLPPISTGTQPYATSQANDPRNGAQIFDGKSLDHQEAESSRNTPLLNERPQPTLGFSSDSPVKRKTSPIPGNGPVEKRPRHDSGDMDIDSLSECKSRSPMRRISILTLLSSYEVENASTGCRVLVPTACIDEDRRPSPGTW